MSFMCDKNMEEKEPEAAHSSGTGASPSHAFEQVTAGVLSSEQTRACQGPRALAGEAQTAFRPPRLPRPSASCSIRPPRLRAGVPKGFQGLRLLKVLVLEVTCNGEIGVLNAR